MIEQLKTLKIVPVVAIDSALHASPLADALVEGGLPVAEITLRTEAGLPAIKQLAARTDLVVGAGTVHSVGQAKQVADAGAKFVVMPGINPKTVQWCLDQELPVFPGVSSPTDLETALDLGLSLVKFFPAEQAGGVAMLKALQGPYGEMRFMPTGGIHLDNLGEYLRLESVVACGGSWMVKSAWMREGHFDRIQQTTTRAVELCQSL